MNMAAYVIAAILGALLCVLLGANVWRYSMITEMVYSAGLVAGAIAGGVVLAIFSAYEKRVIEPMRAAVKAAEKVAESHRTGGNNG